MTPAFCAAAGLLNTTGLFIWNSCVKPCDLSTIVAAVRDMFSDVPGEQITQDVETFVAEMMASRFMETHGVNVELT